jgi:hypothetical protein
MREATLATEHKSGDADYNLNLEDTFPFLALRLPGYLTAGASDKLVTNLNIAVVLPSPQQRTKCPMLTNSK